MVGFVADPNASDPKFIFVYNAPTTELMHTLLLDFGNEMAVRDTARGFKRASSLGTCPANVSGAISEL